MKRIGIALMIIAGIIAGVFIGAYYSEPIMAGIVNSQDATISGQARQITDLKLINSNQKEIITTQDNGIDSCFGDFNSSRTTITCGNYMNFKDCMSKVKI